MLDSDVAMLYHYETKKINQAVKRNIDRFPEKFCFQLTEEEFSSLRSQISTLNENVLLKNDIAIQVSINIMDAFVEMRKFLMINGQLY